VEEQHSDLYMSEEENVGLDTHPMDIEAGSDGNFPRTLIGNLRSYCPSFYFKLSV
jgi:hypothetical protein